MSEDMKDVFAKRATADQGVLRDSYASNSSLIKLIKSLDGLKGDGFEVEAGSVFVLKPNDEGDVYNPPYLEQVVGITQTSNGKVVDLRIKLDMSGEYSFVVEEGDDNNKELSSTNVAQEATNSVLRFVTETQSAMGVDVMSRMFARQEEEAARQAREANKPKAKPKPA